MGQVKQWMGAVGNRDSRVGQGGQVVRGPGWGGRGARQGERGPGAHRTAEPVGRDVNSPQVRGKG